MFVLPLGDENSPRKSFPLFTYLIFALNLFVFYLELRGGEAFIDQWAFIPIRFFANPGEHYLTLITAMFMHGGWLHLGSNMLYLLIFSDNVEEHFGHFKYLLFYLFSGAAANIAQAMFMPDSAVPILGASGAIAGILGAYLVLHPTRKIRVLLGFFMVQLPALIVIGSWFILQLLNGIGSLEVDTQTGGVAYIAHIGGFVVGFLLTIFLRKKR